MKEKKYRITWEYKEYGKSFVFAKNKKEARGLATSIDVELIDDGCDREWEIHSIELDG